jgi:hypothetical protein
VQPNAPADANAVDERSAPGPEVLDLDASPRRAQDSMPARKIADHKFAVEFE